MSTTTVVVTESVHMIITHAKYTPVYRQAAAGRSFRQRTHKLSLSLPNLIIIITIIIITTSCAARWPPQYAPAP